MKIKTVTEVGSNGTKGANMSATFASLGNAIMYNVIDNVAEGIFSSEKYAQEKELEKNCSERQRLPYSSAVL